MYPGIKLTDLKSKPDVSTPLKMEPAPNLKKNTNKTKQKAS